MSLHILDTDTLSLFQKGHPKVVARVLSQPPASVAVTIITVQEQSLGWHAKLTKSRKDDEIANAYQHWADSIALVSRFPILSFTEPALRRFRLLVGMKLNIGRMDLRIAAIALENAAILVTCNKRDFGRVPGLVLEDWTL